MPVDTEIAVLGLGRMGLEHCRQIRQTPGLKLVSASSRSAEARRRAAELYSATMFCSHEELIEKTTAPWIVIATYTHEHAVWARQAISRGKNLIIEKPITLNYAEAEKIFKQADSRAVRVTVHQNRRWDRDFALVRKVLNQGSLGQVYRIESRCCYHSDSWTSGGAGGEQNQWRLKAEYGGGILTDWGSHLFDQLVLLSSAGVSGVLGKTESRVWSREVEDHFWAELFLDDGTMVRIEASNNHRIPLPRWVIIGTEGTLMVEGGEPERWSTARMRKSSNGFAEETTIDTSQPEFSQGFYSAFQEALSANKPLPVQRREVLEAMRLIDAVKESSIRMDLVRLAGPEGGH